MLNGAFNYTWEMTDSHDRLSNRKGSLTRKHLIGATVYYNLPFVQLWFKGCIPQPFLTMEYFSVVVLMIKEACSTSFI